MYVFDSCVYDVDDHAVRLLREAVIVVIRTVSWIRLLLGLARLPWEPSKYNLLLVRLWSCLRGSWMDYSYLSGCPYTLIYRRHFLFAIRMKCVTHGRRLPTGYLLAYI